MYAVVYDDRVIVGPMDWNRGIFSGALGKHGVDVQLPRVPPEQLPLVLTSDARICAVDELRPELNPLVEYYYGPLWDTSGSKAIANYQVVDTPIEFARVNLKQQAAEERWKQEVAGIKVDIQTVEVSVDTSRDGRSIFVQQHAAMSDSDTIYWKFPEAWLNLTRVELKGIIDNISAHVQSCFVWEKSINDQIDAATTKEQLLAIAIVSVQ